MKISHVAMGSSVEMILGGKKAEHNSLNARLQDVDIDLQGGTFKVTCNKTAAVRCFGITNAKWWEPASDVFEAAPEGHVETEALPMSKKRGRPAKA